MDIHNTANCELLVLSKLSGYAFLSQLLVINHPADPVGYTRSLNSIIVSYIIIMYLRDEELRRLGGGQLDVLERIKGHGVRLLFNFWAYLMGLLVYSVLGYILGNTTQDAILASCSPWKDTSIHLLHWNTITTFHHTLEILTLVRLGHAFLLLVYNLAQYTVQIKR